MSQSKSMVKVHDFKPSFSNFKTEILFGLQQLQKSIHAKYLYDKRGSELFEEITRLEEYYPTRTEISILEQNKKEIASCIGTDSVLMEFGSGSSTKTRILLSELRKLTAYVPIDISKEFLHDSAEGLALLYPELNIEAICADYTALMDFPVFKPSVRKVAFFPGSTIGNFEPLEAQRFLCNLSRTLEKGDGLIIGVDLKKDPSLLHSAYNDRKGITAEFNLNLLRRMNRELEANFHIENFRHHAFFNEKIGRIEMHLISLREQRVDIGNVPISFREGETIHTENSYKYSLQEFIDLASHNGFSPKRVWVDANHWFAVFYLEVK